MQINTSFTYQTYNFFMVPINKSQQAGFSIVELTFVVVIVALIIGGLVTAQSMISSSNTMSVVKKIQQYDIAISNYDNTFKELPGDGTVKASGDNDGIIESSSASGGDDSFAEEIANFWKDLSDEGFINDGVSYSNDGSSGVIAGTHIPEIGIGQKTGLLVTNGADSGNDYSDWVGDNYYHLFNPSNSTSSFLSSQSDNATSISAEEALSLDTKMDDAIANSGVVRAAGGNEETRTGVDNTASNGCVQNADATKYQVSSSSDTPCALVILMLSTTGE